MKAETELRETPAIARSPEEVPVERTHKSTALMELEHNLAIATGPITKGLMKYRIDIWNTRRNEFEALDSALLGELTEVYVDMILANNIVWMSTKLVKTAIIRPPNIRN